MFEELPDIYIDNSKHKQVQPINISSIGATSDKIVPKEDTENTETHLSFSTEELIDGQYNDTSMLLY